MVVKTGDKVFDDEKQAVQHLKNIADGKKESASFAATIQNDINTLVDVDQGIASVAISDANATANGYAGANAEDVKQDIAEAQKQVSDAANGTSKGASESIDDYRQAWSHAEDAIKDTTQDSHGGDHEDGNDNHQENGGNHDDHQDNDGNHGKGQGR